MKTLAIIPARGGSKRVPNKNIRTLFDKPLIAHTIMQAKESKFIDKIVVSTDDSEIKRIAKVYLCAVIDRPPELATDTSSTESVIKHVLDNVKGYDTIVLLQCTCPMRKSKDIDRAITLYNTGIFDSVLSVCSSKSILWKAKGDFGYSMTYEKGKRPTRSQDIDYYEENGSIYVFNKNEFMKHMSKVFGNVGLYIMPKERSMDIDTEEDFEYLEWKYGKK